MKSGMPSQKLTSQSLIEGSITGMDLEAYRTSLNLGEGQDEDFMVRYWVARNPDTPSDTLAVLVQDEHWGVRRMASRNISTPYGIWLQEGPLRVLP